MLISKMQSKPNLELILAVFFKFQIFRPLRQKFHPLSVAILAQALHAASWVTFKAALLVLTSACNFCARYDGRRLLLAIGSRCFVKLSA